MSAPTRRLRSALRSPEWIIVAVHAGVVTAPVVFAGTGSPDVTWPGLLITVPLGAVLLAAEVPISLAVARGKRPSHAWWRLLAVAAAVCVPSLWFGPNWLTTDIFLITAGVMLLRRHAAPIIAAWIVWRVAFTVMFVQGFPGAFVAYSVFYAVGWSLSLIGALVGSTWLVRTLGELHATRSELARLAVERERVRLARDLHDLLGQSLSAVSLKGDLALRLLRSDTTAARDEINGVTTIAREALHGIRAITSDRHAMSLATELDGAAALLSAAGIDVRVDAAVPELAPGAEPVLAWAVREGVTNVLRHSDASMCAITIAAADTAVRLEMVNDAAHASSDGGSGLAGLDDRAHELSGTVTTQRDDGRFRLVVQIPGEAP